MKIPAARCKVSKSTFYQAAKRKKSQERLVGHKAPVQVPLTHPH